MRFSFILSIIFLNLLACDSKPKVIVEDSATSENASSSSNPTAAPALVNNDMHQVVALEVLQAERYTYLRVIENQDTFWVAASKNDTAMKGRKYFYKGGLLKTNFYSQEFKREFDKIYLVSSVIDSEAHPGSNNVTATTAEQPAASSAEVPKIKGAVKLSDLFKSKSNYAGKVINVAGKTVKINSGIMGKNWIHIQDGSLCEGKPCDLTITTNEVISFGTGIAFEGKIYLNKDFGAGYKYDIIMEEAKTIK